MLVLIIYKPGVILYAALLIVFPLLSMEIHPSDTSSVSIEMIFDDDSGKAVLFPDSSISDAGETDVVSPLEKEPVLKRFVSAAYPSELAKEGISGNVRLELLVNERGTVDSVKVIKGLHPLLDSSVVEAVAKFEFEPAIADSASIAVILTYDYRITLDAIVDSIREYVNFTGTILERGTRLPVRGAELFVSFPDTTADSTLPVPFSLYLEKIGGFGGQGKTGLTITTTTDSSGRFQFKSLPNGLCRVSVIAVGYEPFSAAEEIRKGEALDAVYRLQKVNYSEYEIVIYGKEKSRETARRTLSVGEVKKIAGFGGDAVKVVQALPGVARSSFGGGAIRVRGAPTWDSEFYLDGVPIPQLYHFGGVKSTYNSDALKSISFYPGGFSVRYGGAVAGVIELEGRSAKRERLQGFCDVSLLDATAFVESPLGKNASVMASCRRSYIGDLLGFAVDKLSIINLPVTVAPFYYDYLLRTDFTINKNNKSFLTIFGSKDALELIIPFMRSRGSREISELADRVRQMQMFSMGIWGWDSEFNKGWRNSLRAALTYSEGYGSMFDFAKFDASSWEFTLRDEISYTFNEKLKLNAGIDYKRKLLTLKADFPDADNTVYKLPRQTEPFGLTGGWIDAEYRPVPKVLIVPGLRFDYYHELDYKGSLVPELWNYSKDIYRRGVAGEPSVRVSSRYEATGKQAVKFAIGTYNQTPKPQGFATSEALGNPNLPATCARQIVAGYEYRFTDLISIDLQLYHNRQWKIPEFATQADLLENPESPRMLPDGKGRMYGLEILLRHDNSERFFGWIAYTLARSERFNRTENRYTLYNRDQTHNLQIVASYRLPFQWELGGKIRYVSGNPYTPIIGAIYDATNRFYRPVFGKENSARNAPFFQTDMRIDKRFVFDRWMLSAYLDMQNVLVFLYQSPEFTVYNYDYTRKSAISMTFIPSLGIRAEF